MPSPTGSRPTPETPRVGIFQDAEDQLFSPTVLEDVAFGPLNLGQSRTEAKAVAKLDHPNILAIHDFGTEGGVAFAVTEAAEVARLAALGSLVRHLPDQPLVDLVARAHLDAETLLEQRRLGDQELVAVTDLAAEVVGQAAVGERDVRAPFEEDDVGLLGQPISAENESSVLVIPNFWEKST
mgnify:CR=1 FL=1